MCRNVERLHRDGNYRVHRNDVVWMHRDGTNNRLGHDDWLRHNDGNGAGAKPGLVVRQTGGPCLVPHTLAALATVATLATVAATLAYMTRAFLATHATPDLFRSRRRRLAPLYDAEVAVPYLRPGPAREDSEEPGPRLAVGRHVFDELL